MRLICLGMQSAKIIFVWGFFWGGILFKDGRGLGSKFQTDFFVVVVTDSLYLLQNIKKCS